MSAILHSGSGVVVSVSIVVVTVYREEEIVIEAV